MKTIQSNVGVLFVVVAVVVVVVTAAAALVAAAAADFHKFHAPDFP